MAALVGFGCAPIGSRIGERQARELLSVAFDHGIRHVDVAPSYGRGFAEDILGRFLTGRREKVRIATKFGIEPAPRHAHTPFLLALGRLVQRSLPRLRQRVSAQAAPARLERVAPDVMRRSVERSLRALSTDHIDTLLFHDCSTAAALADDLRAALVDMVTAGKVGRVGLATDALIAAEIMRADRGEIYTVVQCPNSIFGPLSEDLAAALRGTGSLITHSALGNTGRLAALSMRLANHPPVSAALRELGCDPSTPEGLAHVLLSWALAANPDGVVLVSTTSRQRLEANCATAMQPTALPPELARRLIEIAREDVANVH